MYAIELTQELLHRLARLREQNRRPISHQVRDAVAAYCDREEAKFTAQELMAAHRGPSAS